MPAKSKEQRRLFAIAEHQPDQLYERNKGLLNMKPSQIRDFAATPEKGLPKKSPAPKGKGILHMAWALFVASALAFLPTLSDAACTATSTKRIWEVASGKRYETILVQWGADTTPGTCNFTLTDSPTGGSFIGYITTVETRPGGTAPTNLYDIVIRNELSVGVDVMGGALANRSSTLAEQEAPIVGTMSAIRPRWITGTIYIDITNNAVNSSTGQIIINLER